MGGGGAGGGRHSLLAKIKEEGRARNLTENLKVTVPCGLEETQSWSGRGSSPGDRNEQCSLSFLSVLPVRRGNCSCTFRIKKKREEVAEGKVTDSEPQTSLLHARSGEWFGGREATLPGSKPFTME